MTVDGIQSNIFVGTGFNLVNVEEQTHKGLEIDSLFYITPDFSLTFSASLIDSEYGSFEKGPCDGTLSPPKEDDCPFVNGVLSRFQDFTGRTPAGIPELAITVSGMYTFDLSNSMNGFIRAEYVYEDEIQATDGVPISLAPREVGMLNASLGITDDNSGWNLLLWGRNLNEDEFIQTAFPVPGSPGSFAIYPNQPRTWGLTIGKQF